MAAVTEPPEPSFDVSACEAAFNGPSCTSADRSQLIEDMSCGNDHGGAAGDVQLAMCICPPAAFADAGTACLDAGVPGVASGCLAALKGANPGDL